MHDSSRRIIADRYILLKKLGRGGFGTVWRAFDTLLETEVALKHVHCGPDLSAADREAIEVRLQREVRISAALHDCIQAVRVTNVVRDSGNEPWIVMDLHPSDSLRKVLDREQILPTTEVAAIGIEVLYALREMHSRGFIHRDVTPGNILIGLDGSVKLADFGLALSSTDRRVTAVHGGVVGTPGYTAPELSGRSRQRPAADLFSLGVALFEAAEGRHPFDSRPDAGTSARVAPDPTNSGELAPVLVRLLHPDPAGRPTADEALSLFRSYLDGQPRDTDESPSTMPPPDGSFDTFVPSRDHRTAPERSAAVFTERRISRVILGTAAIAFAALGVSLFWTHPGGFEFRTMASINILLGVVLSVSALGAGWRCLEPTGYLILDAEAISMQRGWRPFRAHWSRIDRAWTMRGRLVFTVIEGDGRIDLTEFEGIRQLPRFNPRTGILTVCRLSAFYGASPEAIESAVRAFAWPN